MACDKHHFLNIELSESILSQGVDFIRTHDLVALKEMIHRFSLELLS